MDKIPLQLSGAETGTARAAVAKERTPLSGILAVGFGLLGIFGPAILFTPFAFLFSLIAIFRGQGALGFVGLLLVVGGFLTSPLLMGIMGLGAVFVLFDWQDLLQPVYDLMGGGIDV